MRRVFVSVVVWGVAGLILLVPGANAAPSTLVVDKDKVQCPNATFTSIQAAVSAAAPGDTVLVCPDLYTEDVTVDKALTVIAKRDERDPRRCFDAAPPSPDPSRDAIVQSALIGFQVLADGVTIDGFIIHPGATGVRGGIGVSGLNVRGNLVENAAFGVSFGPSGAIHSVVNGNCMRGMARAGVNLRSFSTNVSVQGNALFQNGQGMIVNRGSSDIAIGRNVSLRDDIFTLVFPSSRLDISENVALQSQNPDVAAIAVGGTTDSAINRNVISHGLGNGIGFAGPDQGVPANVNIDVRQNAVDHMGKSGIRTTPDSLQNSLVSQNTSSSNTLDGIRIEAGANTNNRVERNVLRRNGEHDCHDDTVGTGTAGTANLWVGNSGLTENRPGLCRRSDD